MTGFGSGKLIFELLPSAPLSLSPQQSAPPVPVTAQVRLYPAAIGGAATDTFGTSWGAALCIRGAAPLSSPGPKGTLPAAAEATSQLKRQRPVARTGPMSAMLQP